MMKKTKTLFGANFEKQETIRSSSEAGDNLQKLRTLRYDKNEADTR